MPTSTTWTHISSTASGSQANANNSIARNNGLRLTVTRTWNWQGPGNPVAARIQLDFAASAGAVSTDFSADYTGAVSTARGGFDANAYEANNQYNFLYENSVGLDDSLPSKGATLHLYKDEYPATQVFETAYVYAKTSAVSFDATATAGAATSTLTGFSLFPQP